jgi:hypothetical protein
VFAFHQSYTVTYDSERDKVVFGYELRYDLDDVAGILIEGFDRDQVLPPAHVLRLTQDAFRTVSIDIESEDLPTELAVHDYTARSDEGLRRFTGLRVRRMPLRGRALGHNRDRPCEDAQQHRQPQHSANKWTSPLGWAVRVRDNSVVHDSGIWEPRWNQEVWHKLDP